MPRERPSIPLLALLALLAATLPIAADQAPAAIEARPFFFALSVADAEASAAWYARVLGFAPANAMDVSDRGLRIRLMRTDTAFLELTQLAGTRDLADIDPALTRRHQVRGVFKVGFRVDDLDAVQARLEALGVSLRGNVVTERDGSMRSLQIEDPDSNVLQLFEVLTDSQPTAAASGR